MNKNILGLLGRLAILFLLPLASLLFGFSVAWIAREQLKTVYIPWQEPTFLGLVFFEGLVVLPASAYLFTVHRSWSILYLFEVSEITWWGIGGILLGSLGICLGACQVGSLLVRLNRERYLIMLLVLVLLLMASLFFFGGERLARLTDGEDWKEAPRIFSTPLGTIFAFCLPALFGGWIFLLVLFGVEAKKIQRASKSFSSEAIAFGFTPARESKSYSPPQGFSQKANFGQDGFPTRRVDSSSSPSPGSKESQEE